MKIALIDNMNNNFFSIARYLRDAGIDAHLYTIPNNAMGHFQPESDTFNDIKDLNWIHEFPVDVRLKSWLALNTKILHNEFNIYDLIISSGMSSAFLMKANIISDIILPYGSDLYEVPFKKIYFSLNFKFIISFIEQNIASYQKKAYQKARVVITNLSHKIYKNAIDNLNVNAINCGMPMLYNLESYKGTVKTFNFLDKHDFIVFNHSRQIWCSNPDNFKDFTLYKGNKRNDKVIIAFSKFLKITQFKNPILVLFEYGPDISCSKDLIKKLSISNNVKWLPKSPRKEILYGLRQASLAVDQVRENICGIGGTSYEILSMGVPLLTYTHGALQDEQDIFYQSPITEVLSETDILQKFVDYEENPHLYQNIGIKSKKWFNQNLGTELAKKYAHLIKLLIKNKSLTHNDHKIRDIFEN